MAKWEDFKVSKEFRLWGNIKEVCDFLHLKSENDILNLEDMNEYWEPLLERMFKLGVFFKQTAKMKEIKVDWIRPCFYIKTELEFVMDGKKYEPDKGSMQAAQKLAREFRYFIGFTQENYEKTDATNFKKMKTDLQKKSSEFFKALIAFATKDCYRYLKANLKEILRPLLDLRKANYHLFILEEQEQGDAEVTLFQDKNNFKEMVKRIGGFFENEEYKMKRDVPDMERFEEYMYKNMSQAYYEYSYTGKKRDEKEITLEANRFRKEALQKKFEEGLDKMLKYLYDKKKEDFFYPIDVHKLFRNIDLLQKNPLQCVKFYLDQEKSFLKEMKIKLWEMKINGLTRVKMPITKNEDLIVIIKKLYDMHNTVEYLMGNKLKYDQFIFFYNCIKFLHESTLKEELITIKNQKFMEDSITNYIILTAIRQASIILEKMRVKSYEKQGKKFKWEDYFQIEKMSLDSEEGFFINAYELDETMKKHVINTPELKETVDQLEPELKEFEGRFWILEGFFPIEDRKLWLEAIELLRNINTLVIDDIRDYLLLGHHDDISILKDKSHGKLNESGTHFIKRGESKNVKTPIINQKSIKKETLTSNLKVRTSSSKGKKGVNNKLALDRSYDSDDESLVAQKNKIPIKLDNLRPPYVWNFPVDQLIIKKNEGEEKKYEIRSVDPTKFYSDDRVKRFIDLLLKIKISVMHHCKETKGDIWKYFFEKTITIWNINYIFGVEKKGDESHKREESIINHSDTNLINLEN